MQSLPRIETVEQAREVLLGMNEQQEITAELDERVSSIKKHNDQEFSADLVDHETGGTSASPTRPTSCWSTGNTTSTSANHARGRAQAFLTAAAGRSSGSPSPAAPSGPSPSAPGAPL